MGAISQVDPGRRLPAPIHVQPYHRDHCFDGKPVLPAVEAMVLLAASVQQNCPQTDCRSMTDARFERFAFLPPAPAVVETLHELTALPEGGVRAELMTRQRAKTSAMSRTKCHAGLVFGAGREKPLRERAPLPTGGYAVGTDRLYRELVPFGSSFQSVKGSLTLTAAGAVARIRVDGKFLAVGPMGAALVLDGAFHAACAWGQRHVGVVAFPVGFARRRIFNSPAPGIDYRAHVFAGHACGGPDTGALLFDIRIYDQNGVLHEALDGLEMRDVSRGRIVPPDWVRV
jgi:hypothetical protein